MISIFPKRTKCQKVKLNLILISHISTLPSKYTQPMVCRFFCTLTKNNFMGLIKLASVDLSKLRLNNKSVIAPSSLLSAGSDWCYQLVVSLPLCLPELPISLRACLCLISPSHFTERKFLEGWARQIVTDLSLPSGAVSFSFSFFRGSCNLLTELKRLIRLFSCWFVQRTHPAQA